MEVLRPDLVADWKPRVKGQAARGVHENKYNKPHFVREKTSNFVYNQIVQKLLGLKKPNYSHDLFLILNR